MKLKHITPYQKRKVKQNLLSIYASRTSEDMKQGLEWYQSANKICVELSDKFGHSPLIVAQVLSALSPRNKWERNIIDTETVLRAVNEGKGPKDVRVCTFNNNKQKAFDIAKGRRGIEKASPKTYSFVKNIAELDASKVTIDVWHLRACFGKTVDSGLTPLRYKQLEKLTLKCAEMVGIRGYEFQAIIWGVVRN
ncbi:DUF7178 family protein [Maribacter arcticus]|mgnify:CR=1 FL=1|uniref:DUF7178 family protein n=1 Tax=Maribacter arcticus TaxID=561365 RepID=UPI003C6DB59E|tara:strand:+ start:114 stop:695 length:582 start_codon:yes stop_codon:yes gene_type:complete